MRHGWTDRGTDRGGRIDNDADKDNKKEDLIPLVLLQKWLNLPASMKLEESFNYFEIFFCPLDYKKKP